ncbi:hypothetical protein HDU92_000511, partial [Lobulomyces angularis]
ESNNFADWLSRRPDFNTQLCGKCQVALNSQDCTLSQPHIVSSIISITFDTTMLLDHQKDDTFCQKIIQWLEDPNTVPSSKIGYIKRFKIDSTTGLLGYHTNPAAPLAAVIPEII